METTTPQGQLALRLESRNGCSPLAHRTGGFRHAGASSTRAVGGIGSRRNTARWLCKKVPATFAGVLLLLSLLAPVGCSRDVRLEGEDLRDVTVKTVTHYGITLDEKATPQDVTYVLLRAIREDFLAKDEAARREAINRQKDLCAVESILQRSLATLDRAEAIHHTVYRWTPTVSHYVSSLQFDREEANKRFVLVGPIKAENEEFLASQVRLELDDPDGDPNAGVVLAVDLVQENNYWRVLRLSYPPKRSIRKTPAKPASASAKPTEPNES